MFFIRYDADTGRVNLITNSDEQIEVEGMEWITVKERPKFDSTRENLYVEDGKIVAKPTEEPPKPPSEVFVYQISNRQFFQALALTHEITREEAVAAMGGKLPARLTQILDTLSDDEKFGAQMLLTGAATFERDHPMVGKMAIALGWHPDEVDALWNLAGSL